MLVERIRAAHRQRCFAMEQRKRVDLALGAFLRVQLGWRPDLPASEQERIRNLAAGLIKEPGDAWRDIVQASALARAPFAEIEAAALKQMQTLAIQLPVWDAFGKDVLGFGSASLAAIVGEAGDLSDYPTHSKLWKRMGLAVMGDQRQGGLRKGASKDLWIEHGYSPKRRSRMWNIGDALIKSNGNGRYRSIYLLRKAHEMNRVETRMHAHRRAQRYMEKRLLRDLWQAWREATHKLPAQPACRGVPLAAE